MVHKMMQHAAAVRNLTLSFFQQRKKQHLLLNLHAMKVVRGQVHRLTCQRWTLGIAWHYKPGGDWPTESPKINQTARVSLFYFSLWSLYQCTRVSVVFINPISKIFTRSLIYRSTLIPAAVGRQDRRDRSSLYGLLLCSLHLYVQRT